MPTVLHRAIFLHSFGPNRWQQHRIEDDAGSFIFSNYPDTGHRGSGFYNWTWYITHEHILNECQSITELHAHTHTSRRWEGTYKDTWKTCTDLHMCTETGNVRPPASPQHCSHPVFHAGNASHNCLHLCQTNLQSNKFTFLLYSQMSQMLFKQIRNSYGSL